MLKEILKGFRPLIGVIISKLALLDKEHQKEAMSFRPLIGVIISKLNRPVIGA